MAKLSVPPCVSFVLTYKNTRYTFVSVTLYHVSL